MIQELEKENYSKISHLLNLDNCNLEPKSVVEQHSPGRIFVDNKVDPKTALILSMGIEGFYIAGDEDNSLFNDNFDKFIDETLMPILKKANYDGFEVSCINPKWNSTLEKLLNKRNLSTFEQYVYKYKDEIPNFDKSINSIGQVYTIDKVFFNIKDINNMDFVLNIINTYWDSIENYLKLGIAYCTVIDHNVASICYSSFLSNNVHAIGIETLEEHRRKGLGEYLTKALLTEYKKRGISPYWDCTTTNVASYKLAEKLGFTKVFKYLCYGFYF